MAQIKGDLDHDDPHVGSKAVSDDHQNVNFVGPAHSS